MNTKERVINGLVYSASGRFSACETQQDFIDQQRLYKELLTEQIDGLLAAERENMKDAIYRYSLTKAGTLGDVAVCDALLQLLA